MKIKKFKKMMAKSALPLILAGAVVAAGAGGAYYYANKQGDKLAGTPSEQTQNQTISNNTTKGETTSTDQNSTATTTDTPTTSATLGDVLLQITKDPDAPTTASVSLYGPAGTYGVEKLVNGSWTTVVAKFGYSGSGGYVFDTISSSAAETHYRVFGLNGSTRTATSGDTTVKWSLVNENGIYTIPIAG